MNGLTAQKTVVISGFIEDASSSERLIGATISNDSTHTGTATNSYGFFSLTTTTGLKNLTFSYIGYGAQSVTFNLQHDTSVIIKLKSGSILREVEVNAKKQERIENAVQMSKITVPIELIQRMPMILGEADVLKGLQLLPGVKGGSEGSAGIYVRGGSPDQNLILLDGVPIYNASHFGGLFSTFNTDAIRNVSLTKGGFPARFGGRLSSVLEIDTKEGNKKEWHAEGAVGILSSRLLVEGPIIKDKLSLMVSLRRTYYDLILYPFLHRSDDQFGTISSTDIKLHFYDFNAKLNYILNDKHHLYLSVYKGNDVYSGEDRIKYNSDHFSSIYRISEYNSRGIEFGNTMASLRWNWLISNRLFVNTTLYYTKYSFGLFYDGQSIYNDSKLNSIRKNNFSSAIRDVTLKTDFDFSLNENNRIRYGANITSHYFSPSLTQIVETNVIDTTYGSPITGSTEFGVYGEDEFKIGDLSANIGLRVAALNVKSQTFTSLEPRIGLNYQFKGVAIKASYSQMKQFVHLLTNDALGLPSDAWVPAVPGIEPEKSQQVALGVAKTFGDNFEFTAETYYKKMDNLVAYKEGSGFISTEQDWEKKVTQGTGEAYGLELFLQKKVGKTAGFIAYTLSWNNRHFDELNNGATFPFKYDRRHEFAILLSHTLKETPNRKITLTANWVFSTGNSITVPTQSYSIFQNNNFFASYDQLKYSSRNGYKTVDTHRFDFSIEFLRKFKKFDRKWNVGLYNAYNHANPFYYEVRTNFLEPFPSQVRSINVVQLSIIPITPFVSYAIKF